MLYLVQETREQVVYMFVCPDTRHHSKIYLVRTRLKQVVCMFRCRDSLSGAYMLATCGYYRKTSMEHLVFM